MTDKDKKTNSKNFSEYWSVERNGDEKSECQQFWQALLRDLFGITEPEKYIRFENPRYA